MRIRKLEEPLEGRAEGMCGGFPYDTELAGPDGVSICFWYWDTYDEAALQAALAKARNARDIVYAVASPGQPKSFWAHSDIN
jgi:hypothetical protein